MAEDYKVEIREDNNVYINGIIINDSIFSEEKVNYRVIEREQMINDLFDWISEASSDKELMKDDLEYLTGKKDEYLFSSILTNEYILKSDNKKAFNKICKEILKLNHKQGGV